MSTERLAHNPAAARGLSSGASQGAAKAFPRADGSTSRGATTPRSTAEGRHPLAENLHLSKLRPSVNVRPTTRRARSAPRARSRWDESFERQMYNAAARKADDKDGEHKYGSKRYCEAVFADGLRDWSDTNVCDVRVNTPKDWRVSSANTLGLGGTAYGHDLSNNNADDWKRSSTVFVQKHFASDLRSHDAHGAKDEARGPKGGERPSWHASAIPAISRHAHQTTMEGSLYRSPVRANHLSTARADECFGPILRSGEPIPHDEYLRKRSVRLGVPQFKKLSNEEVANARKCLAKMRHAGRSPQPTDVHAFLQTLGHQPTDKTVEHLVEQIVDKGGDAHRILGEFTRRAHGLAL